MPQTCVRASRFVAAVAATILVAACGGSSGPVTPVPTPAFQSTPAVTATPARTTKPTPSAAPTPEATESAAASAAANTFVSKRYQYAMTLPPGSMLVNWHSADRAWNGQANLDSGGPYLDRTAVAEGGISMYGAPSASLEEWFGQVEGNGVRYHRCTKAQDRRDASIGDAKAIAFVQVCGGGTETWVRVAVFKEGYGVGMWFHPSPGAEIAGRDKALELLKGLEWRTG